MSSALRDPHHLEIVTEVRRRRTVDQQPFDRRAFAWRVLRLLLPADWTVALYLRDGDFYVDRGPDLRRGADAVSAIVGIPMFATRAEIAVTLAELTGTEDVPFLIDLLVSDERDAAS